MLCVTADCESGTTSPVHGSRSSVDGALDDALDDEDDVDGSGVGADVGTDAFRPCF